MEYPVLVEVGYAIEELPENGFDCGFRDPWTVGMSVEVDDLL